RARAPLVRGPMKSRRMRMQGQALLTAARARSAPFWALLLGILAVVTFSGPASAQSFLGTVRGTVVDQQGAQVSGAAGLVVDESTGGPRATVTDDEGRFEVANLRPGTYRVEVESPSFKKAEQSGLVLKASAIARADLKLEVGGVSETVEVAAQTNDISVESQSVTSSLDAQQLSDLPRSSR